jgi:hypothetical protein
MKFEGLFNFAAETQLLEYIQTSYSVYWGEITPYIKFDIILISCAWGFNSRFNSSTVTQLLVNHRQTPHYPLKLHILSILCEIAPQIKFGFILISFAWDFNLRFNSAANWSYKGLGA